MRGIPSELRRVVRRVRRAPGYALAAAGTIAVAVALHAAFFRLAGTLLWSSPAVAAPERLLRVYSSTPGALLAHEPMAFPDYEDLAHRARGFDRLAAYAWFPVALARGGESELLLAEIATGDYLEMLGVRPELGRALAPDDDLPGAARDVVFLSHDLSRRLFGVSRDALGAKLEINGRSFTVVGVAPHGFRGLTPGLAPDLWLPLHAAAGLPSGVTIRLGGRGDPLTSRAPLWVWVAGRLRLGRTSEAVAAEVNAIGAALAAEHPDTNARRSLVALPAEDVHLLPEVDRALRSGSALTLSLFAAVFLVACLNLAALTLARTLARSREIAVRRALGATRLRTVRELASEGLVLALTGGVLGVVAATLATSALTRLDLPVEWPLRLALAPALTPSSLAYALGLVLLAALLSAVLPAVEASREVPSAALRGDSGRSGNARSHRLRQALVAAQVAIALLLLAASALVGRGLATALAIAPGFDPRPVAVVSISPGLLGEKPEAIERLTARLEREISSWAAVKSVAAASHLPLGFALNLAAVTDDGDAETNAARWPVVDAAAVGPRYFETLSIPILEGRGFEERDNADTHPVAIVNQTLARQLWPQGSAVGRLLRVRGVEQPLRVVGVARDGKYRTLGEPPRPFLYRALRQDPRPTLTLAVRATGDPRALLPRLRELLRRDDPRLPVRSALTYSDLLGDALLVPRLATTVLGGFAALALGLAALGIFGVVRQIAAERRREIGVRLALGARPFDILRWAAARGLVPLAIGAAVGLAAAAVAGRALRSLLYGVAPFDPTSFATAIAVLFAAGALAALLPARRAAHLDPANSLRSE